MSKISIIIGSQREDSESTKVGLFIKKQIEKLGLAEEIFVLDLANNYLPFYDYDENYSPQDKQKIENANLNLKNSDSFVIITPEWGGMATPGIKNIFLLFDYHCFGHKPALITTVSASRGGRYPITELRTSSYKNSRICYLPEHLILDDVKNILNSEAVEADNKSDIYLRNRLDYCLKLLSKYSQGLKIVRESGVIDYDKYPNGM
jgi:NAD(P)H-dependent FMN reductase